MTSLRDFPVLQFSLNSYVLLYVPCPLKDPKHAKGILRGIGEKEIGLEFRLACEYDRPDIACGFGKGYKKTVLALGLMKEHGEACCL
ncbi:MAG: hypothetical protein DCC43_13400 [Candidatus Brocadia sp.]|nr:hypothetical protein [Candidatus Brocadia sp. AMX3]RIJ92861.1 MAG: hypothetical protein DCC43_13400 [Candidatus Brocadia sp.]